MFHFLSFVEGLSGSAGQSRSAKNWVWLLRKFRPIFAVECLWWRTRSGREGLSRPSAAEGGGRRPAFTGLLARTIINHRGSTARLRDGFSPPFFCGFTPPLTSFIGNRLCRGYCRARGRA